MHFVIDRQYWLRGEGSSASALYKSDRADHNMCCLGQIGKQCGITLDNMAGFEAPGQLHDVDLTLFSELFMDAPHYSGVERVWVSDLMQINDDQRIDDEHREMMLTDLIAYWFGHTIEFIN